MESNMETQKISYATRLAAHGWAVTPTTREDGTPGPVYLDAAGDPDGVVQLAEALADALDELPPLRIRVAACNAHHIGGQTPWRGTCGHLWWLEYEGEDCPRCFEHAELTRLRQVEAEAIRLRKQAAGEGGADPSALDRAYPEIGKAYNAAGIAAAAKAREVAGG